MKCARTTPQGVCASWSAALLALYVSSASAAAQEHVASADAELPASEDGVPMCETKLRLSGAVYNDRRPERSFAVVQVDGTKAGAVYRVGTWVQDFELVGVAPRGVLLRGEHGECWLQLVGDASPRVAPTPTRRTQKPERRGKKRTPAKRKEVAVIGS